MTSPLILKAAWERGAFVVASNSDTPEIRALYAWAEIRPVSLKYLVGGKSQKQGKEVIIVGGHP